MKKMNRIIALAVSLVMTICMCDGLCFAVKGNEIHTSGDFEYEVLNDGTAKILSGDYSAKEIIIPAEIDGVKVSTIGAQAFSAYGNLRSLELSDGIEIIEVNAFHYCRNLKSISLSDTLKKIGTDAFKGTAYYNKKENWDNGCLSIDGYVIKGDDSFEGKLELDEDTKGIADYAFYDCDKITSFVIPDELEFIGEDAFEGTAFVEDASKWEGNLLYLGHFLVLAKETESNEYNIKDGTKAICSKAFSDNETIASVNIPSSVKYIGEQAFGDCANLTEVNFSEGLETIDNLAFFSSEKIERVNIPASVTYIGEEAFDICFALESITVDPDNENYTSIDGNLYTKDEKIILQYAYAKTDEEFTFPSTVEKIGEYAFAHGDNLKRIKIPEGVKTIGNNAFELAEGLERVEIADSVTDIGSLAFQETTSLSTIIVGDNVSHIGSNAFDKSLFYKTGSNWEGHSLYLGKYFLSHKLTGESACTVKEGTTLIADGAFVKNEITSAVLPESLKFIGTNAFSSTDLKQANIPDGVLAIGERAFFNCELKSITIPKGVKYIGPFALGYWLYSEDETEILVAEEGYLLSGYEDTVSDEYAERYELAFKAIDGKPEKEGIIDIENGMANPVVRYSDPTEENYTNKGSEILRFCVYVETDYDTDLDGKPDLVKAFVQVPRAAVEGKYKAPVIYEANPYSAGEGNDKTDFGDKELTDDELKTKPAKREASGSKTSMELANEARSGDWSYEYETVSDSKDYYNNTNSYDYFLIRGFAYVSCAGLGSYGSEGLQVCGTDMERQAFKNVVEWLHGDRTAYSDCKNNLSVEADWSSKKIGMIGFSYVGAMAYEVATTGVEGLETVVPIAGPSSWYDYQNSQGICMDHNYKYNYTTTLSGTCASAFIEDYDVDKFGLYKDFTKYMERSQVRLKGDYGEYWKNRDYTQANGIKASALIIQGLNDNNVTPKQFDLMYKAFKRSGITPKAILHQNTHLQPFDADNRTDIMVGDYTCAETLNRWFSHYLVGADNGVEKMANVSAQSNIDGKFYKYDSWDGAKKFVFKPNKKGTTTVEAKGAEEANDEVIEKVCKGKDTTNGACMSMELTDDLIMKGSIEINLKLKCNNINAENTSVCAMLLDTSKNEFNVYDPTKEDVASKKVKDLSYGKGIGKYSLMQWMPSKAKKKLVAWGAMDLKQPEAVYEPNTATKRSVAVKSNEWHNYKLYLKPDLYNFKKGHKFELYLVPYMDGSFDKDIAEIYDEQLIWDKYHSTLDGMIRRQHNYNFTIDNASTVINIPVEKYNPKPVTKKKKNPVKVKVKKKTVKAKTLRKKSVKIKPFKIKKAKGKVTFKILKKGTTKKIRKKVKMLKKGKIKLKKGKYKKKTYKVKVKIRAKGNSTYLAKTIKKTVKIKVK